MPEPIELILNAPELDPRNEIISGQAKTPEQRDATEGAMLRVYASYKREFRDKPQDFTIVNVYAELKRRLFEYELDELAMQEPDYEEFCGLKNFMNQLFKHELKIK